MRYTILHRTRYRYPEPVHDSHTILHLQPRTDLAQYCTGCRVEVRPHAPLFAYTDRFGNDVQHFTVPQEHTELEIVARSEVMTLRGDASAPSSLERALIDADPATDDLYDFLHESPYIAFGPELERLFRAIGAPSPDDDAVAWYREAAKTIHGRFVYDREATSVHTAVDESIALSAGVCQDFAHVLIALCRRAGIPARYVSGYIFSDTDVLGAEASHAWCEAYLGPHGWVGIDPTNDSWVGGGFVRVATGRDYRDVSPVRGTYRGHGEATLSVDVAMESAVPVQ